MTRPMATVSTYITMERSTLDIGRMINSMVKEKRVGQMEPTMRGNMKREKNMEMES